ncbi:MAG: hypothetical protein SF339_00900 [Blastocatellia bacterium]|nr:hypothetical protein [Blastocatellia bacterium]
MNSRMVEQIADAVLYEGYMLYPYRASAVKNRQRFNFGVLTPRSYSEAQGGTENWRMRIECLVRGDSYTVLDVKARFLHLRSREVCALEGRGRMGEMPACRVVPSLEADGRRWQTWEEALEREVNEPLLRLGDVRGKLQPSEFSFPAVDEIEPLHDANGRLLGMIRRRQQAVMGALEIHAAQLGADLFRLTVHLFNATPFDAGGRPRRDEALRHAMVSAHTILRIHDGEFISLLDPPEEFRDAAAVCRNIGAWPVLAGEEGARNEMLASPIILYDYPQVAPESAGDLFDGTEIDEVLLLRILTLTEEEKREMCATDERARQILERAETLSLDQLRSLHGTMRSLRRGRAMPMNEWNERPVGDLIVQGVMLEAGDRVTLRPRAGGDVMDLALGGRTATIEAIEQDYEGNFLLAVVVDDDPGKDLGLLRQPGHRFFFSSEEVEPLTRERPAERMAAD